MLLVRQNGDLNHGFWLGVAKVGSRAVVEGGRREP